MVMKNDHLQKEADLCSDPKPPHFFKIITQDSIEHGNFVFPKRFIRMYGEKLPSDVVRLRVPTGDVWEMELRRQNGDVWLEKKRWLSFGRFYSLGFGHLLVFRLVEVGIDMPEFEVIICDKSTSEIKYPKVMCSIKAEPSDSGCMQDRVEKAKKGKKRGHDKKNRERVIRSGKKQLRDRDESRALQMSSRKKMKMSKASSLKLGKAKKGKKRGHDNKKKHARKMHSSLNSTERAEPSMQDREGVIRSRKKRLRDHESPKSQLNHHKKMKISKASSSRRLEKVQKGEERDHDKKNGCHGKVKQRNAGVKVTRKEVEKEVIGKKKSHFVKFTQSASTRSYCILPVWFAEEIHQVCNDDEVLIKDAVGREWVVKMKYRALANRYRRYDLTTGWKEFRNGNKLAVGDTLEFKHIEGCTIAVKVLPKCNSGSMQDREKVIQSRKKHLRDHDSPNLQLNPPRKMKISKALSSPRLEKVQKGEERDHDKTNGCHGKVKQRSAEVKVTREKVEKEVIGKKKSHIVKFTRPASTRSFCVLPKWFAEEIHQVCNDDEVLIKDAVGREWVVKMKYRAWPNYRRYDLTTGWKEFRNANKLAVGDTLEFKHIKGCTIAVKVLPICNNGSMQGGERVTQSRKKHLRFHDSSNLQLNPHNKKMKISKALSSPRLEKVQKGEERDHDKTKYYAGKMHSLNSKEKAEALLRAESFRSTNPYFTLVMQPSYVNSRFNLLVPTRFMQTYVPGKTGQVKLVCASNGKTWTTRYYICNSSLQVKISQGWETFAKENQLVVGDVCVFELIKVAEGEVSFKVTIFRAPQAAKLNAVDDGVAVTSKSVPSDHPFFQIVIQSSSWALLTVPLSFAKMRFDLERKEQKLTLETGDGSWPVKLLSYKYKSYMSAGVRAFLKGNSLKVGDLCTFELIDTNQIQMVFKVSITRNDGTWNNS